MKIDKKSILTIPNILSVIRIILIYPIVACYRKGDYLGCIIFLVLSGVTDVVDGFIARRFNMISTVGKIIDPTADKLTQAAAVIIISTQYPVVLPLVFVLFFKEIGTLIGSIYLFKKGLRPSEAKWWGKMTTATVYGVCGLFILADCIKITMPTYVSAILMLIPCVCLVFAMIKYFQIFIAITKGEYQLEQEKLLDN